MNAIIFLCIDYKLKYIKISRTDNSNLSNFNNQPKPSAVNMVRFCSVDKMIINMKKWKNIHLSKSCVATCQKQQ